MKIKTLILLCAGVLPLVASAQKENRHIRSGNELFSAEQYDKAEAEYREATQIAPDSYKANFNLGAVQYKQKNYDSCITNFRIVANTQKDKKRVANAHYNIGNALLAQQKYDEAIESYKQSLRNDPTDADAKYNLAYARKMKDQQKNGQDKQNQDKKDDKKDDKQDNKDQQNKDNKDNKDKKDDKKDQNGKDNKDKPQDNKDNKDNKDQKPGDNKDGQNQNQPKPRISKDNAERMLEALDNDEKQTQEKVKQEQAKARKVRVEKDW